MKVLREVAFDEVQQCFRHENGDSKSFDWTNDRLTELSRGEWRYVLLSKSDILNIVSPAHSHGWELESGSTMLAAADRLPHEGICWENVTSHRDRDFSTTHVFLKCEGDQLKHLDGFHRLLAWVIFDKEKEVPTYVVWPR
jgi:hypothetical protein